MVKAIAGAGMHLRVWSPTEYTTARCKEHRRSSKGGLGSTSKSLDIGHGPLYGTA